MPEPRADSYRGAVRDALALAMRADANVILMGEDIGEAGGVFKQTEGLFAEFGAARVIDTPISESGAVGIAVGAAMTGLRPVFEVMFGDFITLVMDQLVNQAAKVHYMSAGAMRAPLVLRTAVGVGASLGPQHSQSLHAWVAHVPGLKVALPADPADAKGLMMAAIDDDNPVVFIEDRNLYTMKGPVPEGPYRVPLGQAAVKRPGRDLSVIATGRMVSVALAAAERAAAQGIEAEIVDPRTLVPLDVAALVRSVKKTGRALVVDGGARAFGAGAEIAATLAEEAFDWLDAPVRRLGAADLPVPFNANLESLILPDAPGLAQAMIALVRG
ncbi:MAG: alpha-ketoacid dehydrogenase subunit beta [Rhodospirillales bacterium]|nr:alpha-ketoacid dehydrogenase subunit beta [Rhodospirillales bacterium]